MWGLYGMWPSPLACVIQMLTLLILLSLVWLVVSIVVIASCRMAARGDRDLVGAPHSPRRPSTCGTVRSRILTSPHSDQLATYR
jgi:hypothetical protein